MSKTETKEIKKEEKKRYEPPTLMWLGELSTASGVCDVGGSAPSTPTYSCEAGPTDGDPECNVGTYATAGGCVGGTFADQPYRPWRLP